MKKALVAGAASFALAAMPVIGVFAADPSPLTDTLTVNVAGACALTRSSGNGQYTQNMSANQLNDNFGSTTFHSECNNGLGYTITASFQPIAHENGSSYGASITYSETTPTAGSGTWTAAATGGNLAEGGNLANTSTQDPAAGSDYTVTYKVSTHTTQGAGTYEGSATYTLTQKTGS